jgi:maltose alpha-D-glucosyltransferase/alpha-amylase
MAATSRPPAASPSSAPAADDEIGVDPRPRAARPRAARPRVVRPTAQPFGPEALWYKDAIIYEVPVRAFRDSNGDGIGDFRGLTEKLDYLRDLGVTAIWVLPFYPSPLKDDGYDIADMTGVHPDYGTLHDVRVFIREAHRRGLRVITELVCNHTSDQHPWFQRARHARAGSPWRDFYVWSDTPDRYPDARIIFKDFESSNWSWDPVADAYYWHRFYAHQPDLNFDNPKVIEAIYRVVDLWLEMGVDGLRLDAIPYLFEREGTNCENLPETHAFLRSLRAHIDERFPDRMLLAEANQWPEDSVAYFGQGDECNMAFHFPVMPRMFMAVRMEDRFPIIDILDQTPAIPENAQWALFLRNHDELTLEMVTDEERDYMYRVYAQDPQMRINLGIRRRLAPLLGNHRRRIELMNGLLFSLPGTPVIYYGDEIGMGDNVYVGDRNGVRTPMQWSGDRNSGFSSANRQRLYLPVIVDPEYHYETVNVEVQQANPHSLLWWMKRLIDLRKRHPAFSRGSLEFLHPDNRRVLAFVRRTGDETILIVANLSRFVQHVELDLSTYADRIPVEMFGRVEFPPVGAGPYFLSLGPHAFLWFTLEAPSPETAGPEATTDLPVLPAASTVVELATGPSRRALADVLTTWIQARRWYRGKARRIKAATIESVVPVAYDGTSAGVVVIRFDHTEGDPTSYLVPLAIRASDASADGATAPPGAIATLLGATSGEERPLLVDAALDPAFASALVDAIGARRRFRDDGSQLVGRPDRAFRRLHGAGEDLAPLPIRSEQTNTSVVFGDRLILKLYRALEPGINPDLEVGRFLTERGFAHTPAIAGSIEYLPAGGEGATAAVLAEYVPNQGDVFRFTLDALRDYFEGVAARAEAPDVPVATPAALLRAADQEPPALARETIDAYLSTAHLLGTRTGEMHAVLASDVADPAFRPEPFSELYQRSLYQAIHALERQSVQLLGDRLETLPATATAEARLVIDASPAVEGRLRALLARKLGGSRIRTHGDFHTGQVLHTGRDLVIIDFEGEPARPLSERRLKRSPLRDVAGLIRSFDYAVNGSLLDPDLGASIRPEDVAALEPWARFWYFWVSATYLRGYREATSAASFLPTEAADWEVLLDVFLIQKAAYELLYELNNRPSWVRIPLRGILELIGG